MNEAMEIIQLATPYVSYVLPAVIIFSTISVSDYLLEFLFFIMRQANRKVNFR
jgi:hypothetical protein